MPQIIDCLWLDLKQGFRRLRKNPGFTTTAVLSLALGIGANTAIFRVISAVRLRSLPVPNPYELVELNLAGGNQGFGVAANPEAGATYPMWQELRRRQRVLSGAFAWSANDAQFGEGATSQMVRALWVSPQAFRVLGVLPVRGRTFDGDDEHCDGSTAVISYGFWSSHYAAQDSAIGSSVLVDDRPISIVGVAPARFFGLEAGKGFDIAVPLCGRTAADPNFLRRDLWWLVIMGRLNPRTSLQAANSQIDAIGREVLDAVAPEGYGSQAVDTWKRLRLQVVPANGGISRLGADYATSLWLLLGIAAMVLLIACSNLTNLLLVQAKARETEIAVRLALGMGKGRLVAQLMTENLVLAILGAVAGGLLGSVVSSLLVALLSTSHNPIELPLSTDWRTLVFTAGLAVMVCVLLGLAPLMRLAGADLANAIRTGSRSGSQQSRHSLLQATLIGSQLAISLFLLVASLTFVRSFHSLVTLDAGFRQEGLVFCFADFSRLRLPAGKMRAFRRELLATVHRTAGVDEVSASTHVPLSGDSWTLGVRIAGRSKQKPARFSWVSNDFFRTLGIPLAAGRTFTERDSSVSQHVMVVNEAFVRQFCTRSTAVGMTVRSVEEPGYPDTDYTIVGVVKDTKYDSLREEIPPAAYVPYSQDPNLQPWLSLIFRTSGPTANSIARVRESLTARAPGVRVHFEVVRTMAEDSMAQDRLLAWLSGVFAVLATFLACVGLYGVIAYTVSLRRAEMAVRMALGATTMQIAGLIIGKTAMLAGVGTGAGLVLSLAGGRVARSLLFHLEPNDPVTMLAAVGILLAVTLLASFFPTLRAALIRPASALRGE